MTFNMNFKVVMIKKKKKLIIFNSVWLNDKLKLF